MSDKVITINIKKSGDIQINICQSENTENISSNENNNIDIKYDPETGTCYSSKLDTPPWANCTSDANGGCK